VTGLTNQSNEKFRLLVCTDMTHDDGNSLIRLLLYPEVFDIEGIIVTNQRPDFKPNSPGPWNKVSDILERYEQVFPQLIKHNPQFSTPDYLRSITKQHSGAMCICLVSPPYPEDFWDYIGIGENKDGLPKHTEAIDFILSVLEDTDARPLYIGLWGGPIALVQALWEYEQKHSSEELEALAKKLRIYDILMQDSTADYFVDLDRFREKYVKDMKYSGNYDGKRLSTDLYITSTHRFWRYLKAVDIEKINKNNGPMCAYYDGGGEGDTPSYLNFISSYLGLNDPSAPAQGGWGGRFILDTEFGQGFYHEMSSEADHMERWIESASRDFYARARWCVRAPEEVNHNPIAIVNGDATKDILYIKASPGQQIVLDGSASYDPDGDSIAYRWFRYKEADSYESEISISGAASQVAELSVPEDIGTKDIHIVLEVKDDGEFNLVAYKRVIISSN
jgi:hypothetical protein